jgi:hypothetical protein
MPTDVGTLLTIAARLHPTLPERPAVFAEKVRLFPEGCRKRVANGRMVGYALAHPWRSDDPPPLDGFLHRLPDDADCLFIHDIALLAQARGVHAPAEYFDHVFAVATGLRLPRAALIAAYGTARLWRRFGFTPWETPSLRQKLATYGADVIYMTRPLAPVRP